MKYAIVDGESKVVKNIAIADPDFAEKAGWVLCPDEVGIGWRYDGTNFLPPPPPSPPPKTPEQLAAEKDVEARRRLAEIDLASIRAIRAHLASKPDAPAELKTLEAEATELRKDIRREV